MKVDLEAWYTGFTDKAQIVLKLCQNCVKNQPCDVIKMREMRKEVEKKINPFYDNF